jgi:S1/P1 Nuclease
VRLVAARTQSDGTGQGARAAEARILADLLLARIRDVDIVEWSIRDPQAWAREAYRVAKKDACGRLRKPDRRHIHRLTDNYARHASEAVSLQLSRAGIRLAALLNEALEPPAS